MRRSAGGGPDRIAAMTTARKPEGKLRTGFTTGACATAATCAAYQALVTGGFAGTTGYTTGRPPVREVFAYWPALVAKSAVTPVVEVV